MKFSIRDLLLVTVIVALAVGWGVDHAMLSHSLRQRAIVQSLLKFEGTAYAQYGDYQYTPPLTIFGGSVILGRGQRVHGYSVRDKPSASQRLLVPLFGEDAFVQVSAVYWDNKQVSDNDLAILDQVPQLRELHLKGTQISDAGLAKIAGLRQLVVLDLSSTKVTSGSVRMLEGCTELRELDISGTEIEYAEVLHLCEALPDCMVR